jgi:hypothetical protein
MKCLRWLCLLLLTSVATISFAGDIQVACEPLLRVFLDGKFVGTSSSKEDCLFLANVPAGAHIIRVEKEGFVPQSFQVEVLNLPIEVKVGEFSPEAPVRRDRGPAAPRSNNPSETSESRQPLRTVSSRSTASLRPRAPRSC